MRITKKRFVQEWVNDLRSCKYRRCTGQLYKKGSYCALGVACKTGERLGIANAGFAKNLNIDTQTREDYTPGEWFRKIMGSCDPYVITEDGVEEQISTLNDDLDYRFPETADALERTFLKRK